jgi:hypothetical protein
MWLTSKRDAWLRVKWWEALTLREEYCTGIWKPPKGTIFPPWARWRS